MRHAQKGLLSPRDFISRLHAPHSIASRTFSAATVPSLQTTLQAARPSYVQFNEETNREKTERIFIHSITNVLSRLRVEGTSSFLSISEKWGLLHDYLAKYRSYRLPPLNQNNLFESAELLFEMFNRPLIKDGAELTTFDSSDYISTPTEYYWGFTQVGIPFTRKRESLITDLSTIQDVVDQCSDPNALPQDPSTLDPITKKVQSYSLLNDEMDAAAATLLATPYINEDTLLHEMGCWNGQNLLNLLFYASTKGKSPKCCVGTDINSTALAMAESVSSFFKIESPLMRFYLANAVSPFDSSRLRVEFGNEIRLALRLLPVIDPSHGISFLQSIRRSLQTNRATVIVSYAVPYGEMYERNQARAADASQSQFSKETFSRGVVFRQEFSPIEALPKFLQNGKNTKVVLNTYYTEAGFRKLAKDCGFRILTTISVKHSIDNERNVVVLIPE